MAPKADLLDKLEPLSCLLLFTKEQTSFEREEEKERIKAFEIENKVFLSARVVCLSVENDLVLPLARVRHTRVQSVHQRWIREKYQRRRRG